MGQAAETGLNQVPAICRQHTTLSVPHHTSHITTATTAQLLHEQQPTTLEEREKKNSGVCSHFTISMHVNG